MGYEVGTNWQALQRMTLITAVSILVSVPLTLVGMAIVFGIDLADTITVALAFKFGLSAAILIPTLLCPITCFKIAMVIRERDRAHMALRQVAQTDQLTGLLNRRGFDAFAQDAIAGCASGNKTISVLMIDIDLFKLVNDTLGHDFGDAALVHVAEILRKEAAAHSFIVGRQGGEEFVAILPGTGGTEAAAISERLRIACSETPVEFNGRSKTVTISVGVASRRHAIASLTQLISEADEALYSAKQQGRNRIAQHKPIAAVASAA